MSSCLRRLDSNHLIGVGDEGHFRHDFAFANQLYSGSLGVDRERLLGIPKIDFGTCHLYPDFARNESPVEFGARWFGSTLKQGTGLISRC